MPDLKITSLAELTTLPSGVVWLVVVAAGGETKKIKLSTLLAG